MTSHMLSHLTPSMHPSLSSELALSICPASPPVDEHHDGMFNATSAATRFSYYPKSSAPFTYGQPATPNYGFGLSFYDEMYSWNGNNHEKKFSERLVLS